MTPAYRARDGSEIAASRPQAASFRFGTGQRPRSARPRAEGEPEDGTGLSLPARAQPVQPQGELDLQRALRRRPVGAEQPGRSGPAAGPPCSRARAAAPAARRGLASRSEVAARVATRSVPRRRRSPAAGRAPGPGSRRRPRCRRAPARRTRGRPGRAVPARPSATSASAAGWPRRTRSRRPRPATRPVGPRAVPTVTRHCRASARRDGRGVAARHERDHGVAVLAGQARPAPARARPAAARAAGPSRAAHDQHVRRRAAAGPAAGRARPAPGRPVGRLRRPVPARGGRRAGRRAPAGRPRRRAAGTAAPAP